VRCLIPLLLCLLVSGCLDSQGQQLESLRCIPPPSGFSQSDLVGTWVGERFGNIDTLIIRSNGQYRQVIRSNESSIAFDGEWLPWRLDYETEGLPYIHLERMRLCAYWTEMECSEEGGGNLIWYDPCKGAWFKMPNEGVLIALGYPKGFEPPPRGFELHLPRKSTLGAMHYRFAGP
jgi:hypothetical protein